MEGYEGVAAINISCEISLIRWLLHIFLVVIHSLNKVDVSELLFLKHRYNKA